MEDFVANKFLHMLVVYVDLKLEVFPKIEMKRSIEKPKLLFTGNITRDYSLGNETTLDAKVR